MPKRLIPRLVKTHPAFAIVYTATTIYHFGMAYQQTFQKEKFSGTGLVYVYEHLSLGVWAILHLVVALLLVFGIYARHHWNVARIGFLMGFFLAWARGILIEQSDTPGSAFFVYCIFIAGCQLAQMYDRKPPSYT